VVRLGGKSLPHGVPDRNALNVGTGGYRRIRRGESDTKKSCKRKNKEFS